MSKDKPDTVDKKEEPKNEKKNTPIPLDEQQMSISDFVGVYKKTSGVSNPYGAAFTVWYNTEGFMLNDNKKLGTRRRMAEWEKLFDQCMKKEIK